MIKIEQVEMVTLLSILTTYMQENQHNVRYI